MRHVVVLCLALTACSSGFQGQPATPPEERDRNLAAAERAWQAELDRRAAAERERLAAVQAHLEERAAARRAYVDANAGRPAAVLAALADARIVADMTLDEVGLVLNDATTSGHGVAGGASAERIESDGLTLTFRNGVLVSWTGAGGPTTVEADVELRARGELVPQR